MKILKIIFLFTGIVLILNSCEGLLSEEPIEEGKFTFWSNFDGPPIDIYINNVNYGSISQYYPSNPGCEARGCVTISLPVGSYDFYAVEKPNDGSTPNSWEDTRTIEPQVCITIGLTL